MSIFSKIKNAIFGHAQAAPKVEVPAHPMASPANAPAPAATPIAPDQGSPSGSTPLSPAMDMVNEVMDAASEVNVEQTLTGLNAGRNLNWQTSIVDLMKLLDIDSSLENRKELAKELGYTGATDGSAEMNTWLHKATMRELVKSGGKVPASMTD